MADAPYFTLRVTSSTSGKDPFQILKNIATKFQWDAESKLMELAEQTRDKMREVIKNSKKRPSFGSNLEDSIQLESLNQIHGLMLGIGNLSVLKAQAKYHEVLDVGGYIPYSTAKGAPLGSFVPGQDRPEKGGTGQNWERSGYKGFFMKPNKAIEGIDYIGIAGRFLRQSIETDFQPWLYNELSK